MQANSSGHSQVPLSILELQSLPSGSGGTQVTLPGLASICANKTYYPNACSNDPNGQCGCVPSDFAPILALDPLLGSAGTVSPLSVDASGATVCANPTASSNCRYVPVPSAKGSPVQQVQILSGPDTVGGDSVCNSFTQTDSTTTTDTLSGSTGQTVGASFKTGTPVFSLSDANTITWTDTQSTGTTSGSGNSQSMNLCSATVACNEDVAVYEDTIFHTFVFQQPSGNNSCP
jgi:hypothetical protein